MKNAGVDPPKINGGAQVTVVWIEVAEAGRGADEPATNAPAGEERRAGGAVVRAGGGILADRAAELAEAQHRHPIIQPGGG